MGLWVSDVGVLAYDRTMQNVTMPGIMAILLGVGLAVLLFVPFVAIEYRKRGRLTPGRIGLWGALLVYGFALWTYTLLPLPDPDSIRCVGAQLTPFQFIDDIGTFDTGSIRAILTNPAVLQVVMNVLLFIPLGFLLRGMWKLGVVATTVIGFGLSLLIEVTQRTGVWGIYPCAYRFFDVDDLIANTTGALIGGILSLVLLYGHSSRHEEAVGMQGPRKVTIGRRIIVALCDLLSFWLLATFVGVVTNAVELYGMQVESANLDSELATTVATWVAFVVLFLPVLFSGRTIGDHAAMVAWAGGPIPTFFARILRYLGGIGGLQLTVFVPDFVGVIFVLIAVVAIFVTPAYGGLPGLISGGKIIDARASEAVGR